MADTIDTNTLPASTPAPAAGPATDTAAVREDGARPAPAPMDAAVDEAAAAAPADYSGLALPEGYRVDDPVFGEAIKLFEGEKIAPDTAQRLIDFTIERDKQIARAVNEHATTSWTKQTAEWRTTSEKEFSPEALGNARTALARVFDRQTIATLESLGFTNHPGLIRGMVKVANAIRDDSFVGGNAGRGSGAMDPKSLYPNSQHN